MSNSKSLLAKLLATENITIRRDASAFTASFDVKNRILTMPVWKGISEDLEDLLTVHETGHALDTPCDGWMDAIKSIAGKYHDKPSNRHTMAVKGFLNVIEDARIDKRQKRRYPGSRRNYLAGYKELLERGFFGPPSKDFNTYNFIDRMNVYFKGGVALGIKFSPDEMPFVKRVESAETFEDVLALTDEIYGWCKAKGEDERRQTPDDMEYEMSEGDDDGDAESVEFDDDMKDDEDGEPGKTKAEADDSDDEDESEGDSQTSQNDREAPGKSGDTEMDDDFVPESQTDETWQEKQRELTDTSTEYVYVTMPKPNVSKIVDDYKLFLTENENWYASQRHHDWRPVVEANFSTFKNEENNTISFMVKEFEMKKSADMYAKISIAKTGVIDTNKLHSYKYNDDIFRRLSTMPQGKNHGFIMFLDWSGSMTQEMKSTMKQLLSIAMFCKRVQIPFEVYNFRDLNEREAQNVYVARNEQSDSQFNFKDGDMSLCSLKLRNILSSRMSLAELNRAFNILWTIAHSPYNRIEPMGGTPLNAAIIVATELVNQFRARNKLQVVNTVFLTDGGSNPILGVVGQPRESIYDGKKRKYVVQDEVTKREFHITGNRIDGEQMTNSLLKSLKDRTGCTLIGFYLYNGWGRTNNAKSAYQNFYGMVTNQKHYDTMAKIWTESKFMPVTSAGYDEYYIINARAMKETKSSLKVDSNMTKGKIAKAFLIYSSKKAVNRVLLQRFINLVAKAQVA